MDNNNIFELTNPQKSIWYMEGYYKGSAINNICGSLFIQQKVNFSKLKQSINIFLKLNKSFGTKICLDNSVPKQYFTELENINFEIIDISSEKDILEIEKNSVNTAFNMIDSLLFTCTIFRLPNGFGGFVFNAHHIIFDAASISLTAKGIMKIYLDLIHNNEIVTTESSYLDYIISEKNYLSSDKFQKDEEYWNSKFNTIPDIASIPSSFKNVSNYSNTSKRESFILSKDIVDKIRELCSEKRISTFNFFMAIYSLYISRVSNLDDFVIGTPILNRTNFKEKNTCGMFISTVPLKISIDNDITFLDLVSNMALDSLSMLRHQKYPYQYLLENLRKQDPSVPNLYDILISYQVTKATDKEIDIPYKVHWYEANKISCGLNIHLHDNDDSENLEIDYDYLIDKYSATDISATHARILCIINQVLNKIETPLNSIEIVTPEEKNLLFNEFNSTKLKYDTSKNIINLFEETVSIYSDKTALISNNIHYTYNELNEYSNILAHYLIHYYNIKPNDIIGVMINRSPEMIIGLLAIIKCGAAYLPLDPDYPDERITYMLENSGTKLVLINTFTEDSIPVKYKKININLSSEIFKNFPKEFISNVNLKLNPNSLLYLIYTSGSTGTPKGVMITNKNVNNFINGVKNIISFSSNKTLISLTTICFDIFGLELWCSLTSGLTLVLANEKEQNNIDLLNDLCLKNKVNMIQTTPSRYTSLFSNISKLDFLKDITDIMVGGESINFNLLNFFKQHTKANIYNMYGPTETTIWSTIKDLTNANKITIGKPIANTKCYILDKNLNLLPPFIPGSLYIGGDSVSAGYLNRPELTHEKFVFSPFDKNYLIYNTNDLAYITNQGELVHLNRTDFQIKLRGYRIELGEIENKIANYPNIDNNVVIPDDSNKYLLCYYTSKEDISITKLSSYLLKYLPNYMIPAYFKKIDKIPLTPNGKINRASLPKSNISENITLPSTNTEKLISLALSKILSKVDFDINTPFLSLGLDSLGLIQLQTSLLIYKLNLTTQDFYRYPSIKSLANRIDSHMEYYTESISNIPDEFKHKKDELSTFSLSKDSNVLGDVLLTGANGFIGIHILYELLHNTTSKIHCFVRGDNVNHSIERLDSSFIFYFGNSIKPFLGNRIEVYNGQIVENNFKLSPNILSFLSNTVNTVIHTAAIVKHYGDFEQFKKINIEGTRNIVEFAYKNKKRFIHISSLSVSGNYLVKQNNKNVNFSENDLYIGQHYTNNAYVNSKFDAEKVVYSYMEKGLVAEIHRIGILSGRSYDGFFQKNISENAFYGRIKALVDLHCVSEKMLNQKIEFTPVDLCAKAIVLLASSKTAENRVFHLFNHNFYTIKQVLEVLNKFNINISILPEEDFQKRIMQISKDTAARNSLKAIINDVSFNNSSLSLDYGFTVNILSDYTLNYLKKLNFNWSQNDSIYLIKLIAYMKYVKFL